MNDSHRATKMKQPHANNAKKARKPKGNSHVTAQEEECARIFQNMQAQVRNRLTSCDPGQELEVHESLSIMLISWALIFFA